HLIPKHPEVLEPNDLTALTASGRREENPESANYQATRAAVNGFAETPASSAQFGLKELTSAHE
ncbi:MAG: hypothetical protein ACLP00_16965, partial [Terracidiphilus sp.]